MIGVIVTQAGSRDDTIGVIKKEEHLLYQRFKGSNRRHPA
jgi:hypothetical protein